MNTNGSKYAAFTTEDFLQDDDFIISITKPTAESEMHWEQLLDEERIDRQAYNMARNFIYSMKIQSEILSEQEKRDIWKSVSVSNLNALHKRNSRYLKVIRLLAGVAAVLTIVVVLNFILKEKNKPLMTTIETFVASQTPITDIQLIIDSDKTLSITGKEANVVYNDEKVVVEDKKGNVQSEELKTVEQLTFNQLIVPYGKRSTLTLIDGSKLWVNAGSRVVYPSSFSKNMREIYVDGEIFAEIVHNEDWPFVVKTKTLIAEVLGTSFDIKTYEKDSLKTIVLVSGSLKINMKNGNAILFPNQMLSHDNNNVFQVTNVNPTEYTSWKDGVLYYESENLEIIMDRLSHYFGQIIVCSPQVGALKCSGQLSLIDDLQTILNSIVQTAPVTYRFENGKYIITHK